MRRGFARYRRIGVPSIKIADLDITPLGDGLHAMARVPCDSHTRAAATANSHTRRRSDGEVVQIRFAHHYFLTLVDGKPRIFAYVATDEQAIMQAHGLI